MVALLRGVNVGGRNRLAMADLRAAAEAVGLADVRTYIQSGNLVFSAAAAPGEIESSLARSIADRTDVAPAVLVRTHAELAALVAANPFLARSAEQSTLHVLFVDSAEQAAGAVSGLDGFAPEEVVALGRELFLQLPLGMGRGRLAPELGRRLGNQGTTRNWRTVTTLLAMADELAASAP